MPALQDGFKTLITLASNPNVSLWEKKVKPFGLDWGGGINTTHMRVGVLHTMAPKTVAKITDSVVQASWNPVVYNEIFAMNQPGVTKIQLITTTFPDGSLLRVYGWLDKFDPLEMAEGEQPMAAVTLIAANTNQDLTLTGVIFVAAP